ncbi:MAG: GNAT family N-acetyltransferase [Promethearchaeota archaeon]
MSRRITKISKDSINIYIEKNLNDFYRKASKHPNFTSNIDDKINWVFSKFADWPSCIFKANLEGSNLDHEIQNIIKRIEKNKVPNGWTIGPLTKPHNLGGILKKYGFLDGYHQSGMALNLTDLRFNTPDIRSFNIKIVNNNKLLEQWSETVSLVFKIKVDLDLLKYLITEKETSLYLGTYGDETVSTLMLYLSSGVAGLHAVTTKPQYRGRGFALRISGIALGDAFNKGYKVAVLQASSLGEKIYRKLGFQKYCDIISYEYPS